MMAAEKLAVAEMAYQISISIRAIADVQFDI